MDIDRIIKALKDGHKVKLANGDIIGLDDKGNVIGEDGKKCTVYMSVESMHMIRDVSDLDKIKDVDLKIVYPEVLDKAEKEYIGNWVRPFRNENPTIKKRQWFYTTSGGDVYKWRIEMEFKGDIYWLPTFCDETMYKRMKPNKGYTLEELGL